MTYNQLGPDKVASAFKGSNRACTSIWAGTEMNQLVMRFNLVPFNLTLSLSTLPSVNINLSNSIHSKQSIPLVFRSLDYSNFFRPSF